MQLLKYALIAIAAVSIYAPGSHAETVLGTGSAFAAPLYTKWASQAEASTGVSLNYQALGSAVGQNQAAGGLTDFGASDVAMKAGDLQANSLLQFPTATGGVAVFVNLPNIRADQLRLTGPVLADIFLGVITRWDDARIASLNPDLVLPRAAIAATHHAAASGTTFAVSRYLAKVSSEWKGRMGVGMSLNWPSGVGVRGSFGAAATVAATPNSIGYAENSYAVSNHLVTVRLMNKAGQFVAPGGAAFAAAAARADWADTSDFGVDLTDMPGEESWPIVSATFVLVPRGAAKMDTTRATLRLFAWGFDHGDDTAQSLGYVPLPEAVKAEVRRSWAGLMSQR